MLCFASNSDQICTFFESLTSEPVSEVTFSILYNIFNLQHLSFAHKCVLCVNRQFPQQRLKRRGKRSSQRTAAAGRGQTGETTSCKRAITPRPHDYKRQVMHTTHTSEKDADVEIDHLFEMKPSETILSVHNAELMPSQAGKRTLHHTIGGK